MTMDARPDDELASAYLDEEATAAERARVEADPVLLARVAELRAAAAMLATPPLPLPDSVIEDQIAVALAYGPVAASPTPIAEVVPLRRSPSQSASRAAPWFAAAAAVVLAFAGAISFLGGAASSQFQSVGNSIGGGGGVAYTDDGSSVGAEGDELGSDPATAPGVPAVGPELVTTSTAPQPVTSGSTANQAYEAARFQPEGLARNLSQLRLVSGEADLRAAVGSVLDDGGAVRDDSWSAPGVPPIDGPTSTYADLGSPPCSPNVARTMAITTRALLLVVTARGDAPIATVPVEVDGAVTYVVLIGPSPSAKVQVAIAIRADGCAPPSFVSLPD